MSKELFGLSHVPLGKQVKTLWDDGHQLQELKERFEWLLESPGVGLLTGEPGVGKTMALKQLTQGLNPHRYQLIYMPETDFGRVDLYRHFAFALGLEASYRRAQLWRDIKARLMELWEGKNILPIWIVDEAHNLPSEFFKDFPSFINFSFDSRDMLTVWFVGHPSLAQLLDRVPYTALASRISARVRLKPIVDKERFDALIEHGFKEAGAHTRVLSSSGIEILRQASQGKPRYVYLILNIALQLAARQGIAHLPDEILQSAITSLKTGGA